MTSTPTAHVRKLILPSTGQCVTLTVSHYYPGYENTVCILFDVFNAKPNPKRLGNQICFRTLKS